MSDLRPRRSVLYMPSSNERALEKAGAAEDADLIASQAGRCRAILADLAARPEGETGAEFYPISASALIRDLAEPRRPPEVQLTILQRPVAGDAGAEPRVARSPELINGLRPM